MTSSRHLQSCSFIYKVYDMESHEYAIATSNLHKKRALAKKRIIIFKYTGVAWSFLAFETNRQNPKTRKPKFITLQLFVSHFTSLSIFAC